MSAIPVDTQYWKGRFDKTCGYLLHKNKFSKDDVCNARFRYGRKNDPEFPITFTRTDYSIITNRVSNNLDRETFWSAVVAPTQSFFDRDWMEWKAKGKDFMEMQLCRLIVDDELLDNMPSEKREEAKLYATTALIEANIIKYEPRAANVIPKPIRVVKKWDTERAPSTDDVLRSLGD